MGTIITMKQPSQKKQKGCPKLRRVHDMHAINTCRGKLPTATEIMQLAEIKAMMIEARSDLVGLRLAA